MKAARPLDRPPLEPAGAPPRPGARRRRRLSLTLALLGAPALALAAGCSNRIPGPYVDPSAPDAGPLSDLNTPQRTGQLYLSAGPQDVTSTDGAPASFSWRAIFRYDDSGEQEDVTDTCAWSVIGRENQRTTLGTIDRGRFTAAPLAAGVGTIRAERQGARTETSLTLRLTASRRSTDDDGSAPPADPASRFTGAASAAKSATLLYPPSGAVLPANLGGLLVQWSAPAGPDLHEVRVQAQLLDLRIYTTSPRRLTLTEADFNLLADAALYGTVTLTVRSGNTSGDGSFGTSAQATLRAATAPSGATYYFATARPAGAGAQGIWRTSWLAPYGTAATPYLTSQSSVTSGQCVGCHSLSADGGVMVVSHDQAQPVSGTFLDMRLGTKRFVSPTLTWLSSALSGDGLEALLSGGAALRQVQTQVGSGPAALATGVPAGTVPVMPSLSLDGQRLVFVRGKQIAAQSELHVTNGSLVTMVRSGGTFGSPSDVVTATGNDNLYYPALSPDGKWLIYNRTSSATAALADSYDNLTAALYAVPVDRSLSPVALTQANSTFFAQVPANTAIASNLSNSFPAFLPGSAQLDGHQVFFFTFSSRRHYGGEVLRTGTLPRTSPTTVRGKVTPGGDVSLTGWNQQLWIAVFDPTRASQGADPSSAALWVPAQSPLSSNHTAVSTQALLGPAL